MFSAFREGQRLSLSVRSFVRRLSAFIVHLNKRVSAVVHLSIYNLIRAFLGVLINPNTFSWLFRNIRVRRM